MFKVGPKTIYEILLFDYDYEIPMLQGQFA